MRRRRRGCGCLTSVVLTIFICALLLGLASLAKALVFAPWASGILGRPTLTGGWSGTMRMHNGAQYGIYLRLGYNEDSKVTTLDGQLSWCTRGAQTTTARVAGNANWSASDVRFFSYAPAHPQPGLRPSNFRGAWHGST